MGHPKYLQRAFETLKWFSHDGLHSGLSVALGKEPHIRSIVYDVRRHPEYVVAERRAEMDRLFEKYDKNPVIFTDDIIDIYRIWSSEPAFDDRLLCIDERGRLIHLEGFFAPDIQLYDMVKVSDAGWGTRHWDCAAASCLGDVTAVTLSESGRITTFHGGHTVADLSYDPGSGILKRKIRIPVR